MAHGALTSFDRTVITATSGLPNVWLGLRLVIGLRRIVWKRMARDSGLDVERLGAANAAGSTRQWMQEGSAFHPQMYETIELIGRGNRQDNRVGTAVRIR